MKLSLYHRYVYRSLQLPDEYYTKLNQAKEMIEKKLGYTPCNEELLINLVDDYINNNGVLSVFNKHKKTQEES